MSDLKCYECGETFTSDNFDRFMEHREEHEHYECQNCHERYNTREEAIDCYERHAPVSFVTDSQTSVNLVSLVRRQENVPQEEYERLYKWLHAEKVGEFYE